jgi:hypothetical protein
MHSEIRRAGLRAVDAPPGTNVGVTPIAAALPGRRSRRPCASIPVMRSNSNIHTIWMKYLGHNNFGYFQSCKRFGQPRPRSRGQDKHALVLAASSPDRRRPLQATDRVGHLPGEAPRVKRLRRNQSTWPSPSCASCSYHPAGIEPETATSISTRPPTISFA